MTSEELALIMTLRERNSAADSELSRLRVEVRELREALELVVAHNDLVPSCTPVCPLVVDLARNVLTKFAAMNASPTKTEG